MAYIAFERMAQKIGLGNVTVLIAIRFSGKVIQDRKDPASNTSIKRA
jgi:hypothetical protein